MSTKPGLQLPVLAMSLVVPVRAFHDQPGCVGEFLRKHVGHPSGLIAFSSMSGGDLQKVADGLEKYLGLAEGRDIAAIDGMNGPWTEIPSVRFEEPADMYRPWFAYLVEEPIPQ
ncbi:MAG: hypothetical protein CMK85_04565 [Pseudomonadales bacterium]|nr:hypothetical protein [Pseudomonadales bacterium]|tara:strand:+ start:118 stop:459 length:342 start_codon:yes stop_codon:yes gene_type:complete